MKTSDLSQELLIELLLRKVKQECMTKMPRLDDEPFSEYIQHIRAEVEYTVDEKIKAACDKKFGKEDEPWKRY